MAFYVGFMFAFLCMVLLSAMPMMRALVDSFFKGI